ncbi:LppX_LprAFG lipoprotein [Nonomuraea sp. NBC_01738]|uniref:LppX_LprAFG lipoprotein n=1 Tax=Nonomuraea sp. NBC_01738 TaxID=2976003 RepID=UPI002E103B31|nr:LppX_LprAFG lipoprotein [Nonomuraea sp. NBC_01738]
MLRKLLIVLALALVSACSSSGGDAAALPSGPELMLKSAEAMKSVKSAAFSISTEGKPKVQVRKADGKLSATGDAEGTLTIDVLGNLQEISFSVVGDTVYFKGPTGGYQKMSKADLAQIYDPSLILNPSQGIAKLVGSAADPRVEGEEDGAYKVAATLPADVLAKLVPGIGQGVNGTVWIDKATSRLTKASLPLQDGTVIVTFSDYDAPVTVTAPTG